MNKTHAKRLVQNAVAVTEPRWRQYAQSWSDVDVIFIQHGYEQQGFHCFEFLPLLDQRGILSIDALGSILGEGLRPAAYAPAYAKGCDSDFHCQLREGAFGASGRLFAEAARQLKTERPSSCGRFFWKLLWHMLQACSFLRSFHGASFAAYLQSEYRRFAHTPQLSEAAFLRTTHGEWQAFLSTAKPWRPLKGVGPNVFDFIVGDIEEAQFASDSYKFDSANAYFLKVTGIASLIVPLERDHVIEFMRSLDLPYTLREINKGIYTYCSMTEASRYGYCRSRQSCERCKVTDICAKDF